VKTLKKDTKWRNRCSVSSVVLSELSPFDKLHLTMVQQKKEVLLPKEDGCRKGIQSDE
jgi:hypothetical protein